MKLKLSYIFILLCSIICSGCVITSSYPVPTKYMLKVETPKKITYRPLKQNLFIHNTSAVPQFSNVNFVLYSFNSFCVDNSNNVSTFFGITFYVLTSQALEVRQKCKFFGWYCIWVWGIFLTLASMERSSHN